MNDSKKRHLAGQIRQFRARFVQKAGAVVGNVLPAQSLARWVAEEAGSYRQRIYDPLQTLMLFIGQVLGADQRGQVQIIFSKSRGQVLHYTSLPLLFI